MFNNCQLTLTCRAGFCETTALGALFYRKGIFRSKSSIHRQFVKLVASNLGYDSTFKCMCWMVNFLNSDQPNKLLYFSCWMNIYEEIDVRLYYKTEQLTVRYFLICTNERKESLCFCYIVHNLNLFPLQGRRPLC